MKKLLVLTATALAAGLALAGCGSLTSYAAKVNGQRVTQNELERELNAILGNKAYLEQVDQGFAQRTGERARGVGKDTFNTIFVARVLERRISYELVRQELVKRKLEVKEADLESARRQLKESIEDQKVFDAFPQGYRDELVRSTAELEVLERSLAGKQADADAVKSFYEGNRASFQTTCVRHILVEDRNKAVQLKAAIAAGQDFGAVARAESRDNQGQGGGSAARGGELGCVPKGGLVAPFETAMDALQPGQVSEPVQTQFGFHLIQVTERKVRSLEEATPEIRQRLLGASPDNLRNFITESFTKAKIVVNPRYGKFVRDGEDVVIRAPKELDDPEQQAPSLTPQP